MYQSAALNWSSFSPCSMHDVTFYNFSSYWVWQIFITYNRPVLVHMFRSWNNRHHFFSPVFCFVTFIENVLLTLLAQCLWQINHFCKLNIKRWFQFSPFFFLQFWFKVLLAAPLQLAIQKSVSNLPGDKVNCMCLGNYCFSSKSYSWFIIFFDIFKKDINKHCTTIMFNVYL